MNGKVINVGGTSRSGSTMLHLILGTAPGAFAVGEIQSFFRPVKTHHFVFDCACGLVDCPRWEPLRSVREEDFYQSALALPGIETVVDSSKEISWLIDAGRWTRQAGLDSVNLFVWKNPIDLAYSYWRRGQDIMFWRSEFVKYYRRIIQIGFPILAVGHSEMARNPQEKIRQTCVAVGLEFSDQMLRFWEPEHHHLFGSLGVRRQVQAGRSTIQESVDYDPEFAERITWLDEAIESDTEVQEILRVLRDHDVLAAGTNSLARQTSVSLSPPFPAWYYVQRAKQTLRRHWPKETPVGAF